jgi:hypothetical protein
MVKTHLFKDLDYEFYNQENKISDLFKIDLNKYGKIDLKQIRSTFYSVDPNNKDPFTPELDDLIRLHFLIKKRKVTTVLEFGIGHSSLTISHALSLNKNQYAKDLNGLRRSNPFELHSIENNLEWVENTKINFKNEYEHLSEISNFHYCPPEVGDFNGRMCTYYHNIPNISPDLIYLDGPDQFSANGSLRGMGTNHPDRMPMSADILSIEHFLCPGTLIVVDGRTANARFLKCNLQRDWAYCHDQNLDQHFFELIEEPLGVYNRSHINFSLGEDWYEKNKHLIT